MLEEEYIRLWRENQQLKNELKEKTEALEIVELKKENEKLKERFNSVYGAR